MKLGDESIKVYDPDKCGLVVEDWIARKTQPGLLKEARKYRRTIPIEEKYGFKFDYSSKLFLCKYRNRNGGQSGKIKLETNTKWLVDLNYFLPQLESILILLRIHLYQNKLQKKAIKRAQMSE